GIRDDLVTGVQTCALPICCSDEHELSRRASPLAVDSLLQPADGGPPNPAASRCRRTRVAWFLLCLPADLLVGVAHRRVQASAMRSEERRVGEGVEMRRGGV